MTPAHLVHNERTNIQFVLAGEKTITNKEPRLTDNLQSSITLPRVFFSSVSSTSVISHGRNSVSMSVRIWQKESKKKHLLTKDEQRDPWAVFHLLWLLRDEQPCQKITCFARARWNLSGFVRCLVSCLSYWDSSSLWTWTRVLSTSLIFKGAWHPQRANTHEMHNNVLARWK